MLFYQYFTILPTINKEIAIIIIMIIVIIIIIIIIIIIMIIIIIQGITILISRLSNPKISKKF